MDLLMAKMLMSGFSRIEIHFYKEDPEITLARIRRRMQKHLPQLARKQWTALYYYDQVASDRAALSPREDSPLITETPTMWFTTSHDYVTEFSFSEAFFKINSDVGNVVSGSDYAGKYMTVMIRSAPRVRFCDFTVQIGREQFIVPLKEAKRDFDGGFTVRLPSFIKQSFEERQRIWKENSEICPGER